MFDSVNVDCLTCREETSLIERKKKKLYNMKKKGYLVE